jgi:signal transduction histidine kinase
MNRESSVIDTEGIMEALEWQVEEFKKNFNISVTLSTLKQDVELGRQKSLHVFRIVQESLTNCVRHSGATKVQSMKESLKKFYGLTINNRRNPGGRR